MCDYYFEQYKYYIFMNKKFIRLGNVIRLGEAGWGFKTKIPSSVQIHQTGHEAGHMSKIQIMLGLVLKALFFIAGPGGVPLIPRTWTWTKWGQPSLLGRMEVHGLTPSPSLHSFKFYHPSSVHQDNEKLGPGLRGWFNGS